MNYYVSLNELNLEFKNKLIFILIIILVLVSVVFITLLEQKVLSYLQIRKGPNKSGLNGLIQSFSDSIKLFLKEYSMPIYSNLVIFFLCPVFMLILSFFCWVTFPMFLYYLKFDLVLLMIFCCLSVGIYFVMLSGWSSNSNYALLGSLRFIAQMISYEVCMILLFLSFIMLNLSFMLMKFIELQENFSFIFLNIMVSLMMLIIFLAESNRSPFDFAEGESELVSGFNIEYSSGGFALIFLSEYMMILFMSMIYVIMFLFNSMFYLLIFVKIVFISFIYILIRGAYPRFRYDKLMFMTWKLYMPISLYLLMFNFSMMIFF